MHIIFTRHIHNFTTWQPVKLSQAQNSLLVHKIHVLFLLFLKKTTMAKKIKLS